MPVLGTSPRDPVYLRIITDLKDCKNHDLRIAMMREAVMKDFWLFCKLVSSFGRFKIEEEDHPSRLAFGPDVYWVDEDFVFDRCRELQNDSETRADNVAYNWSRYMFKTELITKNLTLWELCHDSSLTVAIICFKVEELGENIVRGIQEEISDNKTYHELWPNIFAAEVKDYPLFTTTAITLLRDAGPKEATISVHGISGPTSNHYRRIIKDDCVVAQTVETARTIKKAVKQMRRITAVRSADTIVRNVFTIWDNEDPNMIFLREGVYSRRSLFPALNDDGTANLRSVGFWKYWARDLGPYETSCQLQQKPVAKGDQHFLLEWIEDCCYDITPARCREGKIVHVFTDFSQEKDWSDPVVFRVVGLGVDKKKYQLDLHREKIGFAESIDLLFDICRTWNPDGYVWFEKNSHDMYRAVKLEQVRRSDRSFQCKMLPDKSCQRPKERRIMLLQGGYRRGDYIYPKMGFGHGSKNDSRDTFQQFKYDEYVLWTPEPGSTLHDDFLDTEAWAEDPEVMRLFRYPKGKLSQLHENQTESDYLYGFKPTGAVKAQISGWAY